eukprot:3824964-Rhodomonas_salina.2
MGVNGCRFQALKARKIKEGLERTAKARSNPPHPALSAPPSLCSNLNSVRRPPLPSCHGRRRS